MKRWHASWILVPTLMIALATTAGCSKGQQATEEGVAPLPEELPLNVEQSKLQFQGGYDALKARNVPLALKYFTNVRNAPAAAALVSPLQLQGVQKGPSNLVLKHPKIVQPGNFRVVKPGDFKIVSPGINSIDPGLFFPDAPHFYQDLDGDGIKDVFDNCPYAANADQADDDDDNRGDVCDNCPDMPNDQADADNDGRGDRCDNCPAAANTDQANGDGDEYGDVCDLCPTVVSIDHAYYSNTDNDGDGTGYDCDNCPGAANADQADADADGIGDICDGDTDGDGMPNNSDYCPDIADPGWLDTDVDGRGDKCDNCLYVRNYDQADADSDGIGDLCESFDAVPPCTQGTVPSIQYKSLAPFVLLEGFVHDEGATPAETKANAALGAAIAQMMALYESAPAKALAAAFGQPEPNIAQLLGAGGLMEDHALARRTDTTLLTWTGDFPGDIKEPLQTTFEGSDGISSLYGLQRRLYLETPAKISGKLLSDPMQPDEVLTLERDKEYPVQMVQRLDNYFYGGLCRGGVKNFTLNYYTVTYDTAGRTRVRHTAGCYSEGKGSFSVQKLPAWGDAEMAVTLKDVEMSCYHYMGEINHRSDSPIHTVMTDGVRTYWTSQGFLSGQIRKQVHTATQQADAIVPFHQLNPKKWTRRLLGAAMPGTTIPSLMNQVRLLEAPLQEIDSLLATAIQDPNVQFRIPRELYYGDRDILLNRTDAIALRAGVQLALAGIAFADSWELNVPVSGVFDANGLLTMDRAALVTALNDALVLKASNRLPQARQALASALTLLQEILPSLAVATQNGIWDNDPPAINLAEAINTWAGELLHSLETGPVAFTIFRPSVTVNLKALFDTPPNLGSPEAADLFVVEGGTKIKAVESAVKDLISPYVTIDWTQNYDHSYDLPNHSAPWSNFIELRGIGTLY